MIHPDEFSRRLELLKTEVRLDWDGLVPALEEGRQVFVVRCPKSWAEDLDPETLRMIGSMVLICNYYGAAVICVNDRKIGVLSVRAQVGTPGEPDN